MKGLEVVKRLQKTGWKIEWIKGSHYIMKKGNRSDSLP